MSPVSSSEIPNLNTAVALDEITLRQANLITDLGIWAVRLVDGQDIQDCRSNWSESMYGLMGHSPQTLPAPLVRDFFLCLNENDRQPLLDIVLAAIDAKQPWQMEYRVRQPGGGERVVIEIGQALYDESGKAHTLLGTLRDVTGCRRASAELRNSASRLQLALEGAGAGSYEWNVDTGETVWSRELRTLFGFAGDSKTPPHALWQHAIHPDDIQRVESAVESAVALSTEFEVEWRLKSADGEPVRWFLDRARPMFNEDGSLGCYHGIVIDITEHKLTRLALEQYREQLEEMVSERTSRLSAAQTEQQRLNRTLRLLSDCNITLASAADEQTLLTDLCRLIVLSDTYLLATFSARDNLGGIRTVASYHKATLPENRRLILEKDTKAIGRPSRMALLTGNIQVSQRRSDDDLPASASSVVSGPCMALPILIEDRVEGVLTIYASDRRGFGVQEQALLTELAANTALGLKTLRARKELEGYRHNLEALVAERTREIAALNEQLAARAEEAESANHAKSDFLATMSHEIRTPLNAVVGLTSLLAETPMNRRQRNFTEKIHVAAQHLRTLIDDILDFSKIEVGSLVLEKAPFSLEGVLRTTASILAGNIGKKSIEAIFDIGPDIPEQLVGDAFRLQQVLLNLSSNAVKFTDAGEILISVQHLPSDSRHAHLRFSVRDTGIGIAAEKIAKIFGAFTQADSSTSRRYGGSGLGLAISARLVEAMGGTLEVASAEGHGSDFHFVIKLPLACPGQPALPNHSESLAGLRVLVVDDNPRVGRILQRTCAHFGWHSTILDSAEACLAELQRCSNTELDYDVMLLDWHMPGMDGLEMLRTAHTTPGIGLPLVVLMASADELGEAIAASDDLYIDGIVAKPLTPASVFDAVASAYSGDMVELPPLRASQGQPLTGLRLLVAEDNTLNQEVIQQILTRAGAKVVFADNGQAAVQTLERARIPFDAVLMDIQMPVMDGYAATRKIRENPDFAGLPIIALTAFALQEDRGKSVAAGMSGHITKPIDVDDLLEILGATIRKPIAMPADPPSVVIPGIKVDVALQLCGGDIPSLIKLLRAFIDQNSGDPKKALAQLQAGDIEGAARTVHGIRGVAAYLQATDVARFSASAEEALRDNDTDTAGPAINSLDEAMVELAKVVEEVEQRPPAQE